MVSSRQHLHFNASDRSYFALLKKEIHALALTINFDEKRAGETDIIVAELVSNLSKHATDGELMVQVIEEGGNQGLEIICIDSGPGMVDVSKMVIDGYSTKNTLGHGLGSIKRLSNKFQVYSQRNWGTIVLVRIFKDPPPAHVKATKVDIRTLVIPKNGETACGDGFYAKTTKDSVKMLLGDGLGHGVEAAAASTAAINAFKICPEESPMEMLRFIHSTVKKTRGLVATIATFHFKEKVWRICGVGNISTRIIGINHTKNYIAYNGIVGLNIPNSMNDQVLPYDKGQQIIMCSDGMKSRWDTLRHPGIFRHDLSVAAAILYKDFARHTDDFSIAIGKINL